MLYRKFGKTNETVSILGFGCMRLPILDGDITKIDEAEAIKMIRYAIDHGVNYIDTAYAYHGVGMKEPGASEPLVGKALKDGYREKVKLATKLPVWLVKTPEDFDRLLNEQLERLETDRLDFYLAHSLNAATWPKMKEGGLFEFMDRAIKDGRIKHAGFSFHDKADLFKEIVDAYDWSFCQIQYNYMDEDFQAGRSGLEYAAARGLGISVMEPLRGGKLTINVPEEVMDVFSMAEIKRTPAEWALQWVWNHPEVSVVLSGMSTMEQTIQNVQTAESGKVNVLTSRDATIIEKAKQVFRSRTRINCTACGYCMPCPSGVNISGCFTHYNDYYIFGDRNLENAKYYMLAPKQRALNCVECGKCEEHCPQGIPIREELKKAKELFDVQN
ncbi:MAG: aldo/keto reductase [Clostridia bacterium]|jgi:predicted aldo/keto reductase-like oxidoreductase|nr:aldo/keto reductase [Clostridia bacterium]